LPASFPFVVETMVPLGGFGRRLDDMHAFHRQLFKETQR
jgi:hypothetical protein